VAELNRVRSVSCGGPNGPGRRHWRQSRHALRGLCQLCRVAARDRSRLVVSCSSGGSAVRFTRPRRFSFIPRSDLALRPHAAAVRPSTSTRPTQPPPDARSGWTARSKGAARSAAVRCASHAPSRAPARRGCALECVRARTRRSTRARANKPPRRPQPYAAWRTVPVIGNSYASPLPRSYVSREPVGDAIHLLIWYRRPDAQHPSFLVQARGTLATRRLPDCAAACDSPRDRPPRAVAPLVAIAGLAGMAALGRSVPRPGLSTSLSREPPRCCGS